MLSSDNRKIDPALPKGPSDLTIGDLLDAVARAAVLPRCSRATKRFSTVWLRW